ncbi:hypothetical protein [Streptoalloteichus hindustanus]|uniref:Lipoprotein n=1 Tax=Streptoalloteichus hindustanus TaxID=2017 RepID=A0A1M5N908_STRHI|nr:hypothetical protein [Streptoalloteichus hindustanus]SHG85942.1 hypothetical protein SAMN05444320_11535 [Streptoalloteichus hindustanus]
MTNRVRRQIGIAALTTLPLLGVVGCGQQPNQQPAGPVFVTSTSTSPGSTTAVSSATRPPVAGDGAPHHAENNSWKQRAKLSDTDRTAGEAAAGPVRNRLEELRAKGNISPETVRQALVDLGHRADAVAVIPLRSAGATSDAPPPGAAYGVSVGPACVEGDVRPDQVRVEIKGKGKEFGCMEPFAH